MRVQDVVVGDTPKLTTSYAAPNGEPHLARTDDDALPEDEFCGLLSQSIGPAKICLRVRESSLIRLHEPDETDQVLINKPSVSLAQVLHQHRLSEKMKINLAYTLARSIWQYYDSDWMGSPWTCETIHFMLEGSHLSRQSCIDATKPSCTVHFQAGAERLPERYNIPVIHKYPRVLALGMLLIDIGRTPYEQGSLAVATTQVERVNTDYMWGRRISERDPKWPDLGIADAARQRLRTVYKTATQSCFDKNIFGDALVPASPKDGSVDVEEHRRILYERVVWPLEEIIADTGWTHSLDHIEAIPWIHEAVSHGLRASEKIDPTPPTTSKARSPTRQSASKGSMQSDQHYHPERRNVVLFDDEMPPDGHSTER